MYLTILNHYLNRTYFIAFSKVLKSHLKCHKNFVGSYVMEPWKIIYALMYHIYMLLYGFSKSFKNK